VIDVHVDGVIDLAFVRFTVTWQIQPDDTKASGEVGRNVHPVGEVGCEAVNEDDWLTLASIKKCRLLALNRGVELREVKRWISTPTLLL